MADEGKLLDQQQRALRAKQLLDDELITEAFKTLEDAYAKMWRESGWEQTAAREKLFLAINIVGKVRDHLVSAVINGKIAAAELQQIADAAEHKKRFSRFIG